MIWSSAIAASAEAFEGRAMSEWEGALQEVSKVDQSHQCTEEQVHRHSVWKQYDGFHPVYVARYVARIFIIFFTSTSF